MTTTPDIGPDREDDEALMRALSELPAMTPSRDLTTEFRRRLAAEAPRRRSLYPSLVTGIAALLVITAGAGWWHERQLRLSDAQQLNTQLTAALQSISAGTRLQAITTTVSTGKGGNAVEQALVTALLTDQDASVRVAAAEALGRLARTDALGPAIRRALASENSAFVQMALLDATAKLPAAERVGVIAPILARENIDPMVVNDARARSLARTTIEPSAKEDSR